MIGQKALLKRIDNLIACGFPRFVLLVGEVGSGKKLMCREISSKLGFPLVPIGTGVDEIREVITNSYRNTEPVVYVVADTDKMSTAAKNALLKVTEEPPQKAYFILTVAHISNMLHTIISRAYVLDMNNYTQDELGEYLNTKYNNRPISTEDRDFLLNIATVPQQIDVLLSYDIEQFRLFIYNVAHHVHTVSSANAFKLEGKLALKKDEEKWDVLLFAQALKYVLCNLFYDTLETPYLLMYKLACELVKDLKYKNSANKQYCLDEFILNARKCWEE